MTAEQQITAITTRFFSLFTNVNNQEPKVGQIRTFFLSEGIIIKHTQAGPIVYNLETFIQPREVLLTNGSLVDFKEFETSHKTTTQGLLAHRISHYKKSGVLNGQFFEGEGTKMFQFVYTEDKWMLSSVVWADEE